MSKGKDISTMFTREENKKMEDSDMDWLPKRRKLLSVRHSMEHSCRKEVEENE